MYLSIIIPTYITPNRTPDRLLLSIKGFLHQKLDQKYYEIIIVDDGSETDIEELLKNNLGVNFGINHDIKIIHKNHSGMCSSINLGVEHAKGDYVLIGVDDNVPSFNSLFSIFEAIQSDDMEKRYAYIGCEPFLFHVTAMKNIFSAKYFRGIDLKQYSEKYKKELEMFPVISFDDIVNRYDELLSISTESDVNIQFSNFVKNQSIAAYHWLCIRPGILVLKTDVFKQLNGFDDKFDPSGWYSDLEFGYRLIKHGCEIKYIDNFIMIHLNHIRMDCLPKVEDECFNYFLNKHPLIDMCLLPFLWLDSKLDNFIKYVERTKKHCIFQTQPEESK